MKATGLLFMILNALHDLDNFRLLPIGLSPKWLRADILLASSKTYYTRKKIHFLRTKQVHECDFWLANEVLCEMIKVITGFPYLLNGRNLCYVFYLTKKSTAKWSVYMVVVEEGVVNSPLNFRGTSFSRMEKTH